MGKSIFRWVAALAAMLVFAACGSGSDSRVRNVAAPDFDEPGSFTDFGQYQGDVFYTAHEFEIFAPEQYPNPEAPWLGEKYLSPSFECQSDRLTISMGAKPDSLVTEDVLDLLGIELDSTFEDFALARYEYNGSLKSDFGDDGIVVTDVGLTYFGLPEGPWTEGYTRIPGLAFRRSSGLVGKTQSGLMTTDSHIHVWGVDLDEGENPADPRANSGLVRMTSFGRTDSFWTHEDQLPWFENELIALVPVETHESDNSENAYYSIIDTDHPRGKITETFDAVGSIPTVLEQYISPVTGKKRSFDISEPSWSNDYQRLFDMKLQGSKVIVLYGTKDGLGLWRYDPAAYKAGSYWPDGIKPISGLGISPYFSTAAFGADLNVKDLLDVDLLVVEDDIYVLAESKESGWNSSLFRLDSKGVLDLDWADDGVLEVFKSDKHENLSMFPAQLGGVYLYSTNRLSYAGDGELPPLSVTWVNDFGNIDEAKSFVVDDGKFAFAVPHRSDGHLLVLENKIGNKTVRRVNEIGQVDSSFVGTDYEDLKFVSFTSLEPLSGGSTIGIGSWKSPGSFISAGGSVVVKFDSQGRLEDSFGGEDAYRTLDRIGDAVFDNHRVFVAGSTRVTVDESERLWSVAAYQTNGQIDTSFGDQGLATIEMRENSSANALAVDRRYIYLTGNTGGNTSDLARFHRNGTLDYAFGAWGRVRTGIGNRASGANAVAIDRYQRPTIAGYMQLGAVRYPALQRYTGSGEPDPAFGTKGAVFKKIGLGGEIHDLVVQPNQSIVAVGEVKTPTGSDILVMRYKPNGKLDPTFGKGGRVITDLGTEGDRANAVTLDKHGRIIVTGVRGAVVEVLNSEGNLEESTNGDFVTLRYNSDGKPDASFGEYGVRVTDLGSTHEEGTDVKIDINQRIVVSGTTGKDDDAVFAVVRYLPNGDPDTSFQGSVLDITGSVTTNIGAGADRANALVLLKNGVVVAGSAVASEWSELFRGYDVIVEGYSKFSEKAGVKPSLEPLQTKPGANSIELMYSSQKQKAQFLHVIRDKDTAEFEGAVQTTVEVWFSGPSNKRQCSVEMSFASTYQQPWE